MFAESYSSNIAYEEFTRFEAAALASSGLSAAEKFVELRQPQLRVRINEFGAGEPVLLVHGGNSVGTSWAPLLGLLVDQFRLIVPDRPGCGLTDAFDYSDVDLRTHAVAFVEGLLDALGEQRVAIVGNSMGGFFALAFALAHPDRVSRLILMGEPANASGHPATFHRLVGTRGINSLLYRTALKPPGNAAGARKGFARGKLAADPDRISEALYACFAAGYRLPGAVRSWTTMVERVFEPAGHGLRGAATGATFGLIPELHGLKVPTLMLWGDKDPFGTPEVGRLLADQIPDARLEIVADAGHLPWLEHPSDCADALISFLS